MDRVIFEERVLAPLREWARFGEEINELGTRLIGYAPQIAPRAFMHVVYAPLEKSDAEELRNRLGRPVPSQLEEFLTCANGLSLFIGELRVLGYVPLQRRASTNVYNYPSSLILPNATARMKGLSDDEVVVGFYKADGSWATIQSGQRVVRFNAKDGSSRETWPDFDSWITSEIAAFDGAFGETHAAKDASDV